MPAQFYIANPEMTVKEAEVIASEVDFDKIVSLPDMASNLKAITSEQEPAWMIAVGGKYPAWQLATPDLNSILELLFQEGRKWITVYFVTARQEVASLDELTEKDVDKIPYVFDTQTMLQIRADNNRATRRIKRCILCKP